MHDLLSRDPSASTTASPTNTEDEKRLFRLLLTVTILAVGMLLIIVTATIVYLIWQRVRRHYGRKREEEKQTLFDVLYTHTGSQTADGNSTIGVSSAVVVDEAEESDRNQKHGSSTGTRPTVSGSSNNSQESQCMLETSSFERSDHGLEDSLSQTQAECDSITVSEEHRRNTRQFFDICSKSECLKASKMVPKVVQTPLAETVDECTSSGDSQETRRTMATCGSNSAHQVSLLREYTECKEQHSHPNKKVYSILRGIPWVEGYYSEGRSIEVYVNLEIPLKGALYILKDLTGYGDEKFVVKQCVTG